MKKRPSALAFIWLLLWTCLVFADSHQAKPTIWACDPGTIAFNCARMGLPMPVLAMPMWEGSGGKVYDYSGRGNIGAFVNGPVWVPQGVDFEHTNDQWIANSTPTLPSFGTGQYTIALMVKQESGTQTHSLFSINSYDPAFAINAFGAVYVYDGGAKTASSSSISVGQKQTVAIVRESTAAEATKYYIDGISSGTAQHADTCPSVTSYQIGNDRNSAGTYEFDGIIYYVYIWNVALNAKQIQTLHNNPYGMFEPIKWPIWNYSGAAPPSTFPQVMMLQ